MTMRFLSSQVLSMSYRLKRHPEKNVTRGKRYGTGH
jgi:hypothetical protein